MILLFRVRDNFWALGRAIDITQAVAIEKLGTFILKTRCDRVVGL